MITEDYVSFETAKLLKERGFDYPTETGYNKDGHTIERAYTNGEYSICGDAYNWNKEEIYYSCPTLWETMRWLRKMHHLTIDVFHFRDWKVNIKTIPDDYFKADYSYPELKPAETYEQACEAAIKYCLENLV